MERDGRQETVAELGATLMEEVGRVIPVLPVSLVSTVLLRDPAAQMSELEIKGCVADLVDEVEAGGGRVYVPRQDMDYAVTVGLRMLTMRHLVLDADGLFAANPAELPMLRYYANSIAHLLPARLAVPVAA
jgi:glycerol-3-phosphate O-acyltransferase